MERKNIVVKCGVDTCNYYKNNYCFANTIEVNPIGDGMAKSSDGTCCTTFKPAK